METTEKKTFDRSNYSNHGLIKADSRTRGGPRGIAITVSAILMIRRSQVTGAPACREALIVADVLGLSPVDPCLRISLDKPDISENSNSSEKSDRFVEWAQNEIAVVPDFHKRILFSDEAHFWLNGYVNKQNCRIRREANQQVYVETLLHPEKLIVWCALWAGGILLQKR
ncbi:hypothetical protein TNCV_3961631 [Trichonephila clavipes]|nr:hypothetical protein TNCV_3961631 [Trichonephila clavipes]